MKPIQESNKDSLSNETIELILVKMGILNEQGLKRGIAAYKEKNDPKKQLEEILLEESIISEFDLVRAHGVKYNMPLVNLATQKISIDVLRYVSEEDAKKHSILPVHKTEYILYLAVQNHFQTKLFETISRVSGLQISLLLATNADIQNAIRKSYTQLNVNNITAEIAEMFEDEEEKEEVIDFSEIQGNSIVKAVQIILEYAWQAKASDIHIEPAEKEVRIRFRIDGDLVEGMNLSKKVFQQLVSRLKILASMDIAERRIPQDGRISAMLLGEKVNMRASTLPTIHGEKVVIRILGGTDEKEVWKLEQLNMLPHNLEILKKGIHSANGIVLITGPTGSGKSTTVYAALQEVSKPSVNIVTVEDPVEKMIKGINQVQVEGKAGLDFAVGLRSILRQDPDIIMIGEIRDGETAAIASRAAITGHLVISTLHTNDAASSFLRLTDMGVEPYLIASSVACVVAQRLVKKICSNCKQEYTPKEEELAYWKGELPEKFYHGRGCAICNNSGYKGRCAVHEVLSVDSGLHSFITSKAESEAIKQYLREHQDFKDLRDCTQVLIREGQTTLQELQKICSSMEE